MTREEAIKWLSGLLDAYEECEHGDYFYDNGDAVCEATSVAIAALREQGNCCKNGNSSWISVEDRLPSAEFLDKEIIVCRLNRFGEQRVSVTRFWGTHSALWNDITHWMPLPEPPEVEV